MVDDTATKMVNCSKKTADRMGITIMSFPTNDELTSSTTGTQELNLQIIHKICGLVEGVFI